MTAGKYIIESDESRFYMHTMCTRNSAHIPAGEFTVFSITIALALRKFGPYLIIACATLEYFVRLYCTAEPTVLCRIISNYSRLRCWVSYRSFPASTGGRLQYWLDTRHDWICYSDVNACCTTYMHVQMKSGGQALFDEVIRKLRLVESDYFDLEYTDVHGAAVSRTRILRSLKCISVKC